MMTNADRIRAMTDEELAEFFAEMDDGCPPFAICRDDCAGCWGKRLKQEVQG